jgi:hypothetical protein
MARTTTKTKDESAEVEIMRLNTHTINFRVLGVTPLILNRMSEKAKRELLYPSRKKNAAERETSLKHEPLEEYRASPYRNRDPKEPTLLHLPSGMFKRALGTASLDIPGAFKSQIGRLCSIVSTQVNLFGKPVLKADVVRTAGMAKTPDIRFRACLPEWCCTVQVRYVDRLSPQSVVNLFAASGITVGIGDNRVEKGAGDFGQFDLVSENDEDWNRVATQGRDVQLLGLESPEFYDLESEDLVSWFYAELDRRRKLPTKASEPRKGKKNGGHPATIAEEHHDDRAQQ